MPPAQGNRNSVISRVTSPITCCGGHRGTGSCCCWEREVAQMVWGLHTAQWQLWYVYSNEWKCTFTHNCTLMSVMIFPETTQLSFSCWLVRLWNEPLSHWKRWTTAGLGAQHTNPSILKAEDWEYEASLRYAETVSRTKPNQINYCRQKLEEWIMLTEKWQSTKLTLW